MSRRPTAPSEGATVVRVVRVELADVRRRLGVPSPADRDDWQAIRDALTRRAGADVFAIWLEPLELIALDAGGTLVLAAPAANASWLRGRYGRLIDSCAADAGRRVRLADQPERAAMGVG